jgi:integrase
MKYIEWLNIWLNNYIKPSAKERTYIRYEQLIRTHIAPKIGGNDVNDLTPIVLQSFVAELLNTGNLKTGKELSANFVNMVISVIQNSLKTAHLVGVAAEYSANKIKRPKTKEKQVDCFSVSEQKKIENYVLNSGKDKLFGIVLCLYTGLRIGELLALSWEDIDLGKGLLFVSRTCHDGNDGENYIRIIDSPKTVNSRRVIPLPKQILLLLKSVKKRSQCEYIVADGDKPVFVRSYQRTFELLLKKLNIPHKGFHSLRHTFATRAMECGMDVKTLSELLGHKNATITLNRYAHSMLEHKQDMMNRLGKLL